MVECTTGWMLKGKRLARQDWSGRCSEAGSTCQCVNVDMDVRPLRLQLSPPQAPASPAPSTASSFLRSLELSWIKHWSQSSGSSNIRKPRQMMKTAMRRTVLNWISQVYRSTTVGKKGMQGTFFSAHPTGKDPLTQFTHAEQVNK